MLFPAAQTPSPGTPSPGQIAAPAICFCCLFSSPKFTVRAALQEDAINLCGIPLPAERTNPSCSPCALRDFPGEAMGVSRRREKSWPHSRHRHFSKENSSSQFIFCLGGKLSQTLLMFLCCFPTGSVCVGRGEQTGHALLASLSGHKTISWRAGKFPQGSELLQH